MLSLQIADSVCFWLEGPPLNNQNIATFSAEDQEINSAGWNWAGVASIWGVARTEGKKKTSKIGGVLDWKGSNKPSIYIQKISNTLWVDGW